MSLVGKAAAFVVISLVATTAVAVIAAVMGHPYSTFESVTTFQLGMGVCWLGSIAANTTPKSN